jgi:spore maturation protein CgeB
MKSRARVAFFGASLVSCYWNGAATYYRGLLRALADRGFDITFFEPDAYDRQAHRDIADPTWARVVVFAPTADGLASALDCARPADVLIKASGLGACDTELELEVARGLREGQMRIFWDVDAPATLERMRESLTDPFRACIPDYDVICTYGGGDPVVAAYAAFGARRVVPIYNAVDPATHYRVPPEPRFRADLAFLGNRLPDREARTTEFFLRPAELLPDHSFLLGGAGWDDRVLPASVRYIGHVGTADHNALNSTADVVLNVTRDSMAAYGFSPPTRVFEAAGAAACLITDAWPGIEAFLEPGREVLVAGTGEEVAAHLASTGPDRRRAIGEAAQRRVLAEHSYAHRAVEVERVLSGEAERVVA